MNRSHSLCVYGVCSTTAHGLLYPSTWPILQWNTCMVCIMHGAWSIYANHPGACAHSLFCTLASDHPNLHDFLSFSSALSDIHNTRKQFNLSFWCWIIYIAVSCCCCECISISCTEHNQRGPSPWPFHVRKSFTIHTNSFINFSLCLFKRLFYALCPSTKYCVAFIHIVCDAWHKLTKHFVL